MAPIVRGNSLYTLVDGPSWTQAEKNSIAIGGHLSSINDESENNFVYTYLRGLFEKRSDEIKYYPVDGNNLGIYIGLNDVAEEGNWGWSDGTTYRYKNWSTGNNQPDNDSPTSDYIEFMVSVPGDTNAQGKWNDTSIGYEGSTMDNAIHKLQGIAEIPFVQRGDSAYVIVEGPTWEAAEANAVKLGGHLVTINDQQENDWIIENFKHLGRSKASVIAPNPVSDRTYGMWIGATDKGVEGTWKTPDGNLLPYSNWYYSEPNNVGWYDSKGEDYASITFLDPIHLVNGRQNGTWSDFGTNPPNADQAFTGLAEIKLTSTTPTPTYSLSPSSTSINEGSTLTSTVNTTNVASGTVLYYSLSGTGITSADFSSGSLTGSGTVSSSGSFSFSHSLANDLTTEGTETLQIRLFTDSSRSTQIASTSVSINDTSLTPPALPSYLLTPSTTTINEGSLVSTTINTTNVASGTTLYWSAVGSGITTSDFSFGALSGSASIGSNGKTTFSHVLANDLSTEGSETLNILLYSDSNRSNQIAATSVNVNDTSIAPATPTVAVEGNNTGVINTGTINNSGTINSGTINTNSGNTTNTTTNTSNVTVGPTIINNITNNITNTTTNTTSVLSNTSYPTYNVNNTWANNLVTGAITGSAPILAKNSFDYKFYNLGGGRYGVQEKGSSKIDEITGASSLKFADQTLTPANDVAATFNQVKGKDDVSGVVFRLYNAAFSRLPDANGLQNWINGNASGGMTYASSAQSFSESQEFKNRYGSNVTDTQFITTLYNNVLGRAPDAGGLSHYQSLLAGGRSRGALLLDFSESPENRVLFTQVTGLA